MADVVISGMRPTGRLHLGNYWGALRNWIKLQDSYECSFFVADWHALTTGYDDTSAIRPNTVDMVIDWLAAGIDPARSLVFAQSSVCEHAELSLLLGMITPVNWLLGNPTYKEQLMELYREKYSGHKGDKTDKSGRIIRMLADAASGPEGSGKDEEIAAQSEFSTHGFLGYPVLQAADILLYRAGFVPVGEDQLPHIELARKIARRFSDLYGEGVLLEPKPILAESARVPGIDNRKMSKSYGNAIEMGEDLKTLQTKVMSMFTDPLKLRAGDKGHPEGCVAFAFHRLYNPEFQARERECREGTVGCVACKKDLYARMCPQIEEFRARRAPYEKNPGMIPEMLRQNSLKAKDKAASVLESVRKAMKLK